MKEEEEESILSEEQVRIARLLGKLISIVERENTHESRNQRTRLHRYQGTR